MTSRENQGAAASKAAANPARGTLSGPLPEEGRSAPGDSPSGTLSSDLEAEPPPPAQNLPEGPRGLSTDFELGREVGRGGMGTVYAAVQRSLGREVAVKALLPHLADTRAADRFAAEALITGRLEHPGVPPVHAFGRDANGRPFLAMKLVKGIGWDRLLAPRTEQERARAAAVDLLGHIRILGRVCEAVGFAHSLGIIHRDLKPENVMVGEFGEVQVMDWGIAYDRHRPRAAPAPGGASLPPVGTPAYMPPEMARREDDRLGPWTDVYLLGGILYEILTGSPPHRGATVLEAILAASRGEVEPPRRRAPHRTIPEGLAEIAMRALEPAPERRFRSVEEFARALEDYARHEASLQLTEAALAGLGEAERAIAGRTAPQAAIYGQLAASVVSLEQALRIWAENARAREGLVRARFTYAEAALVAGDLGLAEAQLEQAGAEGDPRGAAIGDRIEKARTARARSERRRKQALVAAALLGMLALASSVQAVRSVRAMMRRDAANRIAGALYGAETSSARIEVFERALAADPAWDQGYFQLSIALCDRAYEKAGAGDHSGFEADMRLAVAALDNAIAIGVGARGYYQRAQVYEDTLQIEKALADYRRTAELSPESFFGHAAAAAAALIERRYAEAIDQATRALALDADADATLYRRGSAYLATGDYARAIADFSESIRLFPDSAMYWVSRADARERSGDHVGAAKDIIGGIKVSPKDPLVLDRLARAAVAAGAIARARALAEAAVASEPRLAELYVGRARAKRAAGDLAGATDDLRRALGIDPRLEELSRDLADLQAESRGEPPPAAAGEPAALVEDALRRGALGLAALLAQREIRAAGGFAPAFEATLARIEIARGAPREAESRLSGLLARVRDDALAARFNGLRATARRLLGDAAGAAQDAERAIALGELAPAAFRERALARLRRGDTGLALLDAERALRGDPLDAEALLARAACLRAERDEEGASADLKLAAIIAPDLEEVAANAGRGGGPDSG